MTLQQFLQSVQSTTYCKQKELQHKLQITIIQWTDEIPYVDNTITHDTSPDVEGGPYVASECANVQQAIQVLSDLFDEIIDNPSVTSPMAQRGRQK